jgi:murein DD-endopeptidase MepM/ murein hydrolase activator NlpD
MAIRGVFVGVLVAIVAAPAGADTIVDQKASVDARIGTLGGHVESVRAQEASARARLNAVSRQIRVLTAQVGDVSAQLTPLERDLSLRRVRLHRIDALYNVQTRRLALLRTQHAIALRRLANRLIGLYEQDPPDTLSLFLSSASFSDLLDAVDYLGRIAEEDRHIADRVGAAKRRVYAQREQTRATRVQQRREARVIALRVSQARALRDRLAASRNELLGVRDAHARSLAALTQRERDDLAEIDALQAVSATLAAKIQAAQAAAGTSDGSPSAAGLIWPVNGPVTSPFGMRWGRMHEGIDIGVPAGTPIRAAAAGTIIYAGWLGGYGNLVAIDHGNGLSTAYGHQSSIAVGYGQTVAQGQVIGYVGSTGHSTGPHLHFEVRVNGAPVDPLGYLS